MRSGDDGCVDREGDSCRRGDDVPGIIKLRRGRRRVLAARLRSPNSEMGDSFRVPVLEATDNERSPSSSPASLPSQREDPRRPSLGWLDEPPACERGVRHSLGLLDPAEPTKDVGRARPDAKSTCRSAAARADGLVMCCWLKEPPSDRPRESGSSDGGLASVASVASAARGSGSSSVTSTSGKASRGSSSL